MNDTTRDESQPMTTNDATRAALVPEPDADAVERAAKAICDVDMGMFPDYVRHIPARTIYLDRARAALAAVPTVQADLTTVYQKGYQDGVDAMRKSVDAAVDSASREEANDDTH